MTDPISVKINSLCDWRSGMLSQIRQAIIEADPKIVEEIKWRKPSNPLGVPTWSLSGLICTGETYKNKIKLTFMKGAHLDLAGTTFNVTGEGVRRAIDIHQADNFSTRELTALVRQAVDINVAALTENGKRVARKLRGE